MKLKSEVARLSNDALTGLSGRGVFDRALRTEFARCRRFRRRLGIVMIDIDNFKAVNDQHGHLVGDAVLRSVALIVKCQVRDCDTVARYGGDECVVLVDSADETGMNVLCERIRAAVARHSDQSQYGVTVSIGFAYQWDTDVDGIAIVERADAALYRAKAMGKNCICGGQL